MIILIDDDDLIQRSWKYKAKKAEVQLRCFHSIEEFLKDSSSFSFEDEVYIDQNLGHGILGSIDSEKIFKLGFKKIYLATGEADIEKPSWIIKVISKHPPF